LFDFSPEGLLRAAFRIILFLLSLSVHEFAHAWAAWRLGDDTAARMGRLTLNPFAHADLVGTYLLPLANAPFAWAKPVPVSPQRFTRPFFGRRITMGTGDILVSVAGPAANLVLGLVAAAVLGVLLRVAPSAVAPGQGGLELLTLLVQVNAGLLVFNLLPFPPLDGGHVAGNLIPYRHRGRWDQWAHVAPMVLLGLVLIGQVTGFSPLWAVLGPPTNLLQGVMYLVTQAIA
jgi:Zn-dependent protease